MESNFVHLRVQSSYSMLESALKIEQIVALAKRNFPANSKAIPAVGMCDRGNLFGLLEFALACKKAKVQPIHGAIVKLLSPHDNTFSDILLIAKDLVGYHNLSALVSYGFIKNDRSICNHISFDDLSKNNAGLIALSCYAEGAVGKALLEKNLELATIAAKELKDLFGDRFYFEIMRHGLEKERKIEESYIQLASSLAIPLVATNNVLFSDVSMHDSHDVLLCISDGVTKEHQERRRVSNQCYFKSEQEMRRLFADLPGALENSVHISRRCHVMAEAHEPMLPNFTIDDETDKKTIRAEAENGLLQRLEAKFKYENIEASQRGALKQQYLERLNYELDIICSMNFAGYFLIVSDFITWSKEQGISVGPGRGSGAGSIVAWSLLITDLDPIKFGLLFERFLNPERISMPDFDIDFCQERREEVINYVRSKYGDSRVAQIITFGKMQAKAVIKDVSRVLGLPYKFADYLTELVPFNAVNPVTLEQAIHEVAELRDAAKGKGLYNLMGEEPLIKQVLETALVLEGLYRHASTHAAGIIISSKDLLDVVPLYKDKTSDMLIVQYSMKYADLAGLIKFDFLGLQTLTVINKCKQLLKQQGEDIDFTAIPFDDTKTYEMLSTGRGTGVFQFESIGMRDALRRLKPDCIDDIIALGALYRPGPMENIPIYIACKHDKQKPDYLHPMLEPILKETYGVIIYQEQVIEIAKVLAGYSLGSADLLRRAMGKKIKAEMDAQEEQFVAGAKLNGIADQQAKSIFATVAKFAGYGFNKAHASAYGVISYQTAYLKANFPAEFLTVCLNLEIDNNDKINLFIQEAKFNQIRIIPPNINSSFGYFYTVDSTILYAIGAIKNVTTHFGEIAAEERAKNGLFKTIVDFIERIPPKLINRRLLENLIKAGCFDSLHENRTQLLLSIPKLMAYLQSYHEEQHSKQISLIAVNSISPELLVENVEVADNYSLALDEFEALGLFVRKHPLDSYEELLAEFNIINSLGLHTDLVNGASQIKIAGVIQKKDSRMSARGRFVTLQLSDQFGIFDITIFSEDILKTYVHLLDIRSTIVAHCDVFKDEGVIRLTAKSFATIDEVIKQDKRKLELSPKNHLELRRVIDIIKKRVKPNDANVEIILLLPVDGDFIAKIQLPDYFCLEKSDFAALKEFYN